MTDTYNIKGTFSGYSNNINAKVESVGSASSGYGFKISIGNEATGAGYSITVPQQTITLIIDVISGYWRLVSVE